MKVHSTLGNRFQEVIYQRAMAIEMTKQNLSFQREMEMEFFYEGENIGTRRVEFFCRRRNNGRTQSTYQFRRCSFGSGNELLSGL